MITDPIFRSQRQIRANFQEIATAFATNHTNLTGDQTFAGMHTVLTLRSQAADPTTSPTQIAIYQKLVSAIPELFYRPSSNGPPIQLTYPSIKTGLQSSNPDVYFNDQYTFIAGPFVIYGGKVTNPSQGQTVTLTPSTTLIFVDLIMANVQAKIPDFFATTAIPTNIVGNSFNISFGTQVFPGPFPTVNFDIYYFAVGV